MGIIVRFFRFLLRQRVEPGISYPGAYRIVYALAARINDLDVPPVVTVYRDIIS